MQIARGTGDRGVSMKSMWLVGIAITTLCSCDDEPEASRFVVMEFLVESDPGVPLELTKILVNGSHVGHSDRRGNLRATVRSTPEAVIRIDHECPEGFAGPGEAKHMRMRDYKGVRGSAMPAMQVRLRCRPLRRRAVFVVRARGGSHLPVFLNGDLVTHTNAEGVAHFSAEGSPGAEYVVKLDTLERPSLVPHSPTHLFALSDEHQIFVVDQVFERTRTSQRRRVSRPRITKIE